MVDRSPDNDDGSMFPDAFIPLGQVPAAASRVERAADELRHLHRAPHRIAHDLAGIERPGPPTVPPPRNRRPACS